MTCRGQVAGFAKLIQIIWELGQIPQQMQWMIVVLLPKGGGNYYVIGLPKPFWKSVEVIMDKRLQSIESHDCLHVCVCVCVCFVGHQYCHPFPATSLLRP